MCDAFLSFILIHLFMYSFDRLAPQPRLTPCIVARNVCPQTMLANYRILSQQRFNAVVMLLVVVVALVSAVVKCLCTYTRGVCVCVNTIDSSIALIFRNRQTTQDRWCYVGRSCCALLNRVRQHTHKHIHTHTLRGRHNSAFSHMLVVRVRVRVCVYPLYCSSAKFCAHHTRFYVCKQRGARPHNDVCECVCVLLHTTHHVRTETRTCVCAIDRL